MYQISETRNLTITRHLYSETEITYLSIYFEKGKGLFDDIYNFSTDLNVHFCTLYQDKIVFIIK